MKRRQSSSSIPCLIRIRNGTFSCIFSHFSNHEEMMKWQNNLHITNCAESKTQRSWNLFSRNLFRTSLWVKIFSLCAQAQHAKDGQCCTNLSNIGTLVFQVLGYFEMILTWISQTKAHLSLVQVVVQLFLEKCATLMTSVQARHQLCIIEHGKVKFTDIRVNPIIVRDFRIIILPCGCFPLKGTMISFQGVTLTSNRGPAPAV